LARNFRNNTKNKKQNNNQNSNDNYACSPYNFIPFPKTYIYRYKSLDDIPNHNNRLGLYNDSNNQANDKGESIEKNEELLSGVIDYSIRCHTPLFISDGNEDNPNFFTINDEYVIPGSTLRGKIRTNTEILSNSYPEFVENQKLWFRGLADKSKKVRNDYQNLLKNNSKNNEITEITNFVKAGYLIKNESNKYEIIQAFGYKDKNGNEHSFRLVKEPYLKKKIKDRKYKDIFMFRDDTPWGDINDIKQNKGIPKFEKQRRIGGILRRYQNFSYMSYFVNVDYSVDYKNELLDIKIKNDQKENGMLMNSSSMGSKQNHYLIYQKDESKSKLEIEDKIIDSFLTNVLHQQSSINYMPMNYNDNKRIDLRELEDNVEVPVFYKVQIDENDKEVVKAIGFTPYMKLPFKNDVLDGISNRDNKKIDYAEAIYGFTNKEYDNEKKAYKGRVYFENAKISTQNDNLKLTEHTKILSNPKITSFQLYLTQDYNDINRLSTYNDNNFELRGYKFYWLKDDIYTADKHLDERAKNNMKIQTRINALDNKQNNRNLEFESKIHFSNLTKDELGLLLYSIKPFKEGRESIGQGKPFGFGQVEFNINSVKFDKGISNLIQFNNEYIKLNELQIETLKNSYITKFNKLQNELQKEDLNDSKNNKAKQSNVEEYKFGSDKHIQLRDLYISKTTIVKKNNYIFNYMKLKDFKDRKILQTTKELKDTYYKSNDNLKLPDIQSEFSLNTEKEKIKENFDLVRMSFEYKKEDLKIIKKDILDFVINKKDELINIDKELNKFADDFEIEILLSENKDGNRLLLDELKDFIYNIKKIHQQKLDSILDFENPKNEYEDSKDIDDNLEKLTNEFESYIKRYKGDYNHYDWAKNLESILNEKKEELKESLKKKENYKEENLMEDNNIEEKIRISIKYSNGLETRLKDLADKFKNKVNKKELEEAKVKSKEIEEYINNNKDFLKELEDIINKKQAAIDKIKKATNKKQTNNEEELVAEQKRYIEIKEELIKKNNEYTQIYNSTMNLLTKLENELNKNIDKVKKHKEFVELKIKETLDKIENFDLENNKNIKDFDSENNKSKENKLNAYYETLQIIDNDINKRIKDDDIIFDESIFTKDKYNSFNVELLSKISNFAKSNKFDYEFFKEIVEDLEYKQNNVLKELDYRKRQSLTYYIDNELIPFNEKEQELLTKISKLKETYLKKEMDQINEEFEKLKINIESVKTKIGMSSYKAYLIPQFENLNRILDSIRKEIELKKLAKDEYYQKVDKTKNSLGYSDLRRNVNDIISSLNRSMANMRDIDLNSESYITSTSKLLIISENKNDERVIKPAIASFTTVEYILLKDENINSIIRQNDCVIFNNIDGELKRDEIVHLMNADSTNAYVYYNDNNKRFFYNNSDSIFTFSNTRVTLYSAIINVLRFRTNDIQGVN
jgi:CRISPR-associated protein (TIGR03986 family)